MISQANTATRKPAVINLPFDAPITNIAVPAVPSLHHFTGGTYVLEMSYKSEEWHHIWGHIAGVGEPCKTH